VLFGDVSQPGHLSAAGVGDQDVEAAAAFGDRDVQRVKGGQVGDVAHDTNDVAVDVGDGGINHVLAAPGQVDLRLPSAAKRRAVSSPIPALPPVTSATLPSSCPMVISSRLSLKAKLVVLDGR